MLNDARGGLVGSFEVNSRSAEHTLLICTLILGEPGCTVNVFDVSKC